MLCPQCGGTNYEVVSPSMLRCTARVIVNAVPPGLNGNMSGVPIPIWGDCDTEAPAEQWIAAAREADAGMAAAQQFADTQAAERQRLVDLEQRKSDLLAQLRSRGNPGIQSRLVPGGSRLSFWARVFDRSAQTVSVVVSPAWKFGTCTWIADGMRGSEDWENWPTGITPEGMIVPMNRAARTDDVDDSFNRRKLWPGYGAPPAGFTVRPVNIEDVVRALEKAAAGR